MLGWGGELIMMLTRVCRFVMRRVCIFSGDTGRRVRRLGAVMSAERLFERMECLCKSTLTFVGRTGAGKQTRYL